MIMILFNCFWKIFHTLTSIKAGVKLQVLQRCMKTWPLKSCKTYKFWDIFPTWNESLFLLLLCIVAHFLGNSSGVWQSLLDLNWLYQVLPPTPQRGGGVDFLCSVDCDLASPLSKTSHHSDSLCRVLWFTENSPEIEWSAAVKSETPAPNNVVFD